MDIENCLLQHGATCHIFLDTIAFLHDKFHDLLISQHGDQEWPAR